MTPQEQAKTLYSSNYDWEAYNKGFQDCFELNKVSQKDAQLAKLREALESLIRHCETYDLEHFEPVVRSEQTLKETE